MALFPPELLLPVYPGRELHQHEQSGDTADGYGQAGVALPEECVGEENQIHQLGQGRLYEGKFISHHDPHVRYHQEY